MRSNVQAASKMRIGHGFTLCRVVVCFEDGRLACRQRVALHEHGACCERASLIAVASRVRIVVFNLETITEYTLVFFALFHRKWEERRDVQTPTPCLHEKVSMHASTAKAVSGMT